MSEIKQYVDHNLNGQKLINAVKITDTLGNPLSVTPMTIALLRAVNTSVFTNVVYITDVGKEGIFYFDSADVTSVDNLGFILVTANNKRFKRDISNGINVKWFGAVGNGVTNDAPAINQVLTLVSTSHTQVIIPEGTYKINSTLLKPQTFFGLNMKGVGHVVFDFTGMTGTCLKIKGGSSTVNQAVIENIRFNGTQANGICIELADQCGQIVRNCIFLSGLVGVSFHNEHGFSEKNIIENCRFDNTITRAVEYKRTTATSTHFSFNGSGLGKNNAINTMNTVITVGDGCLPYNCPLNAQVWINAANCVFVVNNNTTLNWQPSFHGELTFENMLGSMVLGTGAKRTFFAGSIVDLSDGVNGGNFICCKSIKNGLTGSMLPIGIEYNGIVTMSAGTTVLTNIPTQYGPNLVTIMLIGPNYDYRYVLQVEPSGFTGIVITGTIITNSRSFNASGQGAPVFSVADVGTLSITNAAFTSSVKAYISVKQLSMFNYGNLPSTAY